MEAQKRTSVWRQRDGTPIRVCDMSDSHLRNTLAMLRRNAERNYTAELCAAYSVEATLTGEMAQFFCDRDIREMEQDGPCALLPNIYHEMQDELDSRG